VAVGLACIGSQLRSSRWDCQLASPRTLGRALATRQLREQRRGRRFPASAGGREGHRGTQLALAWLLAQGDDIVPIPGTRRPERLEQNVAAANVQLTDADLTRIEEILPEGAYGSRYPAAMMPIW
jgi:aryl-alcohol dehydrogenase-like predicted oxidoreductase